jgi:predicted dehydrogenase
MKVAVLGLGSRGRTYGGKLYKRGCEMVAICDLMKDRLEHVKNAWNVPADMCFTDENEFFGLGKIADVMVIATQDRDHFGHAMKAMELGYDLLLEKPLDPDINRSVELQNYAKKHGRKVLVCHVLRYSGFYKRVKKLLDGGAIGEIKEIRHSENVGYWHFSHSYVRGNWRREDQTTPIIYAKTCHDMDLLYWFTGSKAKSVNSFGDLSYFTSKNAPLGATDTCFECPLRQDCIFDAEKHYIGKKGFLGIRSFRKVPWGPRAFSLSTKPKKVLNALKNDERGNGNAKRRKGYLHPICL